MSPTLSSQFLSPGVRPVLLPPNPWRQCLQTRWQLLEAVRAAGGVRAVCCSSLYAGENPPWQQMPRTGRRYLEQGSVAVGALTLDTDYTVLSFTVPHAVDGVMTQHYQMYTGAGFIEGSGVLRWRIRVNRAFLKDYGNTDTSFGNTTSPIAFNQGRIRLYSQDQVSYIVRATDLTVLDPTARIAVGILGYYYPQE